MKRLTDAEQAKCIGLSVCGGGCKTCPANNPIYKKLAELEDKIEQGRLLELPCKIGDTVYVKNISGYIGSAIVNMIFRNSSEDWISLKCDDDIERNYEMHRFGKTIFLTREEAERAKGGVDGGN